MKKYRKMLNFFPNKRVKEKREEEESGYLSDGPQIHEIEIDEAERMGYI